MKDKKACVILIVLSIFLICTACTNKGKKESTGSAAGSKELNLYIDIKDRHSLNLLKLVMDDYSKENKNTKININNILSNTSLLEDINKGNTVDALITSRNRMIELSQKGILSEMGTYYEKNKIRENSYNVMSSYGRVGDKYYGTALFPYTVEMYYSKDALKKQNMTEPKNMKDLRDIVKSINASNQRIPVILTDDLDMYSGLASTLISDKINVSRLESIYGGTAEEYKKDTNMQNIFDEINTVVRETGINRNTFELGNEMTLNRLKRGDIPLVIAISYYNNQFKGQNVGIIEDMSVSTSEKSNTPVIVNALLCIPTNSKNGEQLGNFLKFLYDVKTQKKLAEQGFVVGNKKANEEMTGINKISAMKISNASENNIPFVYNMPEKYQNAVSSRIERILSGKYTKTEWQDIITEVNK